MSWKSVFSFQLQHRKWFSFLLQSQTFTVRFSFLWKWRIVSKFNRMRMIWPLCWRRKLKRRSEILRKFNFLFEKTAMKTFRRERQQKFQHRKNEKNGQNGSIRNGARQCPRFVPAIYFLHISFHAVLCSVFVGTCGYELRKIKIIFFYG